MQIYGPRSLHGAQSIGGPHAPKTGKNTQTPTSGPIQDELQLSEAAQAIDKVDDIPDIRTDRVKEIRAQIEAGTYETPEKLETALNRLFDELA